MVKNINCDIFNVLNVISSAKVAWGGQKTDFLQLDSSCLVWFGKKLLPSFSSSPSLD